MIQRPLVWMLAVFIIGYISANMIFKIAKTPNHPMDQVFDDQIRGSVEGAIYRIDKKEQSTAIYLKNVIIIPYGSSKQYFSNQILVYFSDDSNLKIDNIVCFWGQILKFQKPTNLGQFNELNYYKQNGIDYKVFADKMEIKNQASSFYSLVLSRIKNSIWKVYQQSLSKQDAGIIGAMVLGEKSLLDLDIKELYKKSGISHILSISGLHISLIGLFLYKILRKIQVQNLVACIITIIGVISYGYITSFSVSTLRAVIMMVLLFIGSMIGRTYDLRSAMAFSGLIILFENPLKINSSGLLLSFSAILGIAYIGVWTNEILKIQSNKKNLNFLSIVIAFVKTNLITSICINLTTLPIIMNFFYEFPLYAVFLNIIIIPLMSLLLLLALVSGGIGCLNLQVGRFFCGGVHYILEFYNTVCNLFLQFPYHSVITGKPQLVQIVFYYFVLVISIFMAKKFQNPKYLFLLILLFSIFYRKEYEGLEITILDLGQGDGIFFQTPSGTTYLVDGGSLDVREVGAYRLEPFLKAKAVNKIDYAVVTHVDQDHISGLSELIAKADEGGIDIEHLLLPNTSLKDDAYKELLNLAIGKGIEIVYIEKGDEIQDGEVLINVLHPTITYEPLSRNGYSTVLGLHYKEFDMLLTGDVEEDGESLMVQAGVLEDYDVLKIAHHGSLSSTTTKFLEKVKPEYSVISCGKDNPYGHPHKDIIKRIEDCKSEIYITSKGGSVIIKTDGEKIELDYFATK